MRKAITIFIILAVLNKSAIAQNYLNNSTTIDSITVISRHITVFDSLSPFVLTKLNVNKIGSIENRTLPEVLMGSSGVFIQKTSHGGGSAFIRGLTGNQTLILVDGIRLNNSTFRYGPNQYLNTIDIFNINKIEVAKGMGAVAYGSDAMGGVINLLSKDKGFNEIQKWEFNNLTRFTSSSIERANRTELNYVNKIMSWDGGISFKNYGDLVGGGNIGKQYQSGYSEFNYNSKIKFKTSENSILTFSTQKSSQYDVPIFHKILLENFKINQVDLQMHSLNYLRYNLKLNNRWRQEIIITVSNQKTIEQRSNQKNNTNNLRKEADTVNTYAFTSEIVTSLNSFWKMNTGIDYYQDRVNSIYTDINTISNSSTNKRGLYPNNAQYKNSSVFNLHHINFQKWDIQSGFRYNMVNIEFTENTLGAINVKTASLVGDFAISYKLANNHIVYSSMASGYRTPNIDDLGSLGIVDFRYEIPAYDLKPEKSLNTELGYKFFSAGLQINVSAYYMQLKDIITRVKIDGKVMDGYNVYNKTNFESAYIKGFEISFDKNIGAHLKWSSNTTYTYGQNVTKKEPMRRIPPMFGQNSIMWHKNKTSLQVTHQYAGAQNRLAQGDKDDNRIGILGTPQWNIFNLTGAYTLKQVKVQLGLLNVLNEKYKTHGSGIYGMGSAMSLSIKITI